jgi:hypothetical protein
MNISEWCEGYRRHMPELKGLLVVAAALANSSCAATSEASPTATATKSRQYIIALDLSGSRAPSELANGKVLVGGIVDDLMANDQVVLLRVAGTGAQADVVPRTQTMPHIKGRKPTKSEQIRLDHAREGIRAEFEKFMSENEGLKIRDTDLITTVSRIRDLVLDGENRETTLVVLSDMIQDAAGQNYSRMRDIPTQLWIEQRQAQHLIPDLRQVCVTAVGADATNAIGVARREFWQNYFHAAGADLATDNYRLMMPRWRVCTLALDSH